MKTGDVTGIIFNLIYRSFRELNFVRTSWYGSTVLYGTSGELFLSLSLSLSLFLSFSAGSLYSSVSTNRPPRLYSWSSRTKRKKARSLVLAPLWSFSGRSDLCAALSRFLDRYGSILRPCTRTFALLALFCSGSLLLAPATKTTILLLYAGYACACAPEGHLSICESSPWLSTTIKFSTDGHGTTIKI